jgi:hypothetical protein
MHATIQIVCESLDKLHNSILEVPFTESTLTESFGWSSPALNKHDLSIIPRRLSYKLRIADINTLDEDLKEQIEIIPDRINLFILHSLPQLFTSNSVHAASVYMSLMEWISLTIDPLFSWQTLGDNKAMPAQLARRLRGIQIELDNLVPNKELLESQIKLIKEATETAESLPADLETLKHARAEINHFSSTSAELYGKIDTYFKDIEGTASKVREKSIEADALVKQCQEAYRITTSVGLAGAFDQRANRLSVSMWIWVGGLLLALGLGAWIGAHRVGLLTELIKSPNPQWGGIWIHLVLSILSISAPIWFAWLATKQINQRFRLSEDYAFKASVAKAYEGYRREAARIDVAFEARLFSSTLSRLEEAPLRLVESDPHGSPWHELFSSVGFQTALNTIPELKDQFISLAKNGVSRTGAKNHAQDSEQSGEKP